MPLRDQKTLAVSHATAYVNCSGGFCKRLNRHATAIPVLGQWLQFLRQMTAFMLGEFRVILWL